MELLQNNLAISKIILSIFVPIGHENPIHKNRPSHGFAFNIDCDTTYRFDTGETLTCHSGELIYLPRFSNYTVSSIAPKKDKSEGVYAINFLFVDENISAPPVVMKVKAQEDVLSCFIKATNTYIKGKTSFQEQLFIELYKIIKILKKESFYYSAMDKTLKTLSPALQYIENNYQQEIISISHLACLCKISEPYLRKLFNDAFSTSPALYIRNMRIKYAKTLLRSGEYSVTGVAMLSGFNDPSYFCREFKKATGSSPKEYQYLHQ